MKRSGVPWAVTVVSLWALAVPFAATAQEASPTLKPPLVEGEVTGDLAARSRLTFSVDVTMPGGWEGLHLVEIVLRSGARELEAVLYDIEDVQLKIGEQKIVVGTGGVATGEYLRVSGADVVVTTGGGNMAFEVTAVLRKALPEDARFELGIQDDFGRSTSITERLAEPPPEGLTWGTVVAAILVALLAGGMAGNLFATKRRSAPRFSIYGTIDRRIRSERESSSGG